RTFNAYQTSIPTHNPTGSRVCGFVMSLNPIGTELLFSTYFGGGNTRIYGLCLDKLGTPCITGFDLPEDYDPLKPDSSFGVACFAARLDSTLSSLLNINRFHLASPTGMALDPAGNAYVTGTAPYNFPTTPQALEQNFAGDRPFTGPGRPSDKSHNFVLQIRGLSPPPAGSSVAHASAASFAVGSLAADSIVAAFSADMTKSIEVATSIPLPTMLSGLQVKVRDSAGADREAPLFFISPNQANYLIPAG